MSYFGDKLRQLMELNSVSGLGIQKATGINCSQISRWHSGKQKMVSLEDLALLCKTVTKNKHERAELIAAHLRDECYGPGAELVQISIAEGERQEAVRATIDERMSEFLHRMASEKPFLRKALLNLAANEGFE